MSSLPKSTKRPWTKNEDELLLHLIDEHGCNGSWPKIAVHIEGRTGKQCRERYLNQLDPSIKRGNWTKEEDAIILHLHKKVGNKWTKYLAHLPGRSDNSIKNRWHVISRDTYENGHPSPNYSLYQAYLKRNPSNESTGSNGSLAGGHENPVPVALSLPSSGTAGRTNTCTPASGLPPMPITFASTHGSPPKNRAPQLPVSSSINNTYPPPPPSLPPPATAAYDVSPSAPPDSEISGDLDDLLRYFSDDLKELENTEGMEEEEIRGGSQQGYTTTTSVDSMSSDAPAGSDASSHRMLLPSHMGVASISSDGFADVPSNYYRSTTTSSSSGSGSGSGSFNQSIYQPLQEQQAAGIGAAPSRQQQIRAALSTTQGREDNGETTQGGRPISSPVPSQPVAISKRSNSTTLEDFHDDLKDQISTIVASGNSFSVEKGASLEGKLSTMALVSSLGSFMQGYSQDSGSAFPAPSRSVSASSATAATTTAAGVSLGICEGEEGAGAGGVGVREEAGIPRGNSGSRSMIFGHENSTGSGDNNWWRQSMQDEFLQTLESLRSVGSGGIGSRMQSFANDDVSPTQATTTTTTTTTTTATTTSIAGSNEDKISMSSSSTATNTALENLMAEVHGAGATGRNSSEPARTKVLTTTAPAPEEPSNGEGLDSRPPPPLRSSSGRLLSSPKKSILNTGAAQAGIFSSSSSSSSSSSVLDTNNNINKGSNNDASMESITSDQGNNSNNTNANTNTNTITNTKKGPGVLGSPNKAKITSAVTASLAPKARTLNLNGSGRALSGNLASATALLISVSRQNSQRSWDGDSEDSSNATSTATSSDNNTANINNKNNSMESEITSSSPSASTTATGNVNQQRFSAGKSNGINGGTNGSKVGALRLPYSPLEHSPMNHTHFSPAFQDNKRARHPFSFQIER